MQVKFAIKASNKTGQIKSVSNDEMLYILTSTSTAIPLFPAQHAFLTNNKNTINGAKTVLDASNFNGAQQQQQHQQHVFLAKNEWRSTSNIRQNWLNYRAQSVKRNELIIHGISKVFITLIVCLWWIGSIGIAHCTADNDVITTNQSETSHQIKWPSSTATTALNFLAKSTITAKEQSQETNRNSNLQFSSSIQARQTAFHRDRIRRRSLSSMLILNILKTEKRSGNHLDEKHHDDERNVHKQNKLHRQEQQKQQQKFGISIITHSKKTNPNTSFSLDLFKHSGHVQRHDDATLNSLDTESNRLPDAIRKSLQHYHSVINQIVTKRYQLSANTKDKALSTTKKDTTTTTKATAIDSATLITNDQPIEPPLKHLIKALSTTTIDQQKPVDSGNDLHNVYEIVARHHIVNRRAPFLNHIKDAHVSEFLNQTELLLRDLHTKYFKSKGRTSGTLKIHHKAKRSTDMQNHPKPIQTHTPFDDDHFFNSKLQNYYFLYHIDNISNYNNHFDLLNSPNLSNATQIQLNKQRVPISNHKNDNALMDGTSKSNFLTKYNSNTLHFNNHNSNYIRRILFAKIATICLNCFYGNDDLPVKVYILPTSLHNLTESSATATSAVAAMHLNFLSDFSVRNGNINGKQNGNETDSTASKHWDGSMKTENQWKWDLNAATEKIIKFFEQNHHNKRFLVPIDSSLKNSLKKYPHIASLLGNLSLAKISDPSTIKLNQNVRPNLHSNLNVFINDSTKSSSRGNKNAATATLYQLLIDANSPEQVGHYVSFLKSPTAKSSNIKIVNNMHEDDENGAADDVVDDGDGDGRGTSAHEPTIANISNNSYSPISTFENYIRIISSYNINKHKSYYAKMDGNKSKSLNFQHLKQQFKRVKKQKQIIQLFAKNYKFIHNNDTLNDKDSNNTSHHTNGNANDSNVDAKNYKLNFTLNESNCTTNVLNFNEINRNVESVSDKSSGAKNQNHQQPAANAGQKSFNGKTVKTMLEATVQKRTANLKQEVTETIQIIKNNNSKVKKNDAQARSSNAMNSYLMRLESIKYQILMKLGLKQKPNITNTLPKHVIMETLYRAKDTNSPKSNANPGRHFHSKQHRQKQKNKQKNPKKYNKNKQHHLKPPILLSDDPRQQVYQFEGHRFSYNKGKNNSQNDDQLGIDLDLDIFEDTNDIESDDFYGRTREIIIFAEKGSYFNHQPLIEFVSTNGLDESLKLNSVNSNEVVTQTNHTLQINNSTQKQRIKCKGDIIENRQVRKRKRRRAKVFESNDFQQTAENESVILVKDKKHVREEAVVKSSSSSSSKTTSTVEQTHYQQPNFDENYSDVRVRRAFLWIKVDEVLNKSNNFANAKHSIKNQKSKLKPNSHGSPIIQKSHGRRHSFRKFFRLWVFQIVQSNPDQNQQIKLSASKSVHISRLGWQKMDVTSTVREWYANGSKTRLRFLVDCSGCVNRIKIHLFNGKSSGNSKARAKPNLLHTDKLMGNSDPVRPFLVIYTDPHVMKRVRRHTPDCSMAARGQCCKQKFFVSFAELGWEDWIIAPHGYYANYCQGNCNGLRTPDNFRSYHSHVIEEYRKMNRLTGLQPCCTPLKFSSMSLIYYEENQKIIKRDLPKMIVDECGCP